jgi:cytochrome P450
MHVRRIVTEPRELPGRAPVASQTFDPDAFDPHDPAFLANPYPTYALFREHAPVYPVKPYDACWTFSYEDCAEVLDATDVWLKNPPGGHPPERGPYAMMASFPGGLFVTDPPLHTELRELLEPVFTRSIEGVQDRTRAFAEPLLRAAREKGSLELVADYALPLPASVLFSVLGIPPGDYDQDIWKGLIASQAAIAAAHDLAAPLEVRAAGATCSMALNTFFEGMLLTRHRVSRSAPEGLFAQMCATLLGAGLSPQQVQVCASDLLVAGYLSTTFIVGLGVRNLLLHPDQLEKLRADPSLARPALEEMLRYDGSVHIVDRWAADETGLGGRTFAPGEKIAVIIGSANRDPARFEDPDRFDIERRQDGHLAFGEGIHICIGAPLARIVAPVALEMLLAEFDELYLEGEPQWQTDPYLRAVRTLPLRF